MAEMLEREECFNSLDALSVHRRYAGTGDFWLVLF